MFRAPGNDDKAEPNISVGIIAVDNPMKRTQLALQWDPAQMQPLIDVAARYKQIPQGFSARELWWAR